MRKKTFLKLVEYQTEQTQKHLDEVRMIHREMRGYKHDFHHHLQALKGQIEAGEYERALAYIEELDRNVMSVDTLLKTGNVCVDAVLSAKLAKAKEMQIVLMVKANICENLLLSDVDLSIVIGNMLDNAIEACMELPQEERFIRLYLSLKGTMLYFSMINSAGEKQRKMNQLFRSRKNELHGFGLRRAADIVEKYGGWCKFNSEDGAFTSEILVPALKKED